MGGGGVFLGGGVFPGVDSFPAPASASPGHVKKAPEGKNGAAWDEGRKGKEEKEEEEEEVGERGR